MNTEIYADFSSTDIPNIYYVNHENQGRFYSEWKEINNWKKLVSQINNN